MDEIVTYGEEKVMLYITEARADKLLAMCRKFVDDNKKTYEYSHRSKDLADYIQKNDDGIGCYFYEKEGKKINYFLGLSPKRNDDSAWSVAVLLDGTVSFLKETPQDKNWAYFPLKYEILEKICMAENDLQEEFNNNVSEVIKNIKTDPH